VIAPSSIRVRRTKRSPATSSFRPGGGWSARGDGADGEDEQRHGDRVHGDRLDREDHASQRRPGDDPDLAGDATQSERAREQLRGDELRCQRPGCGRSEG